MTTILNEQLTPREHILLENETEQNRLAREHAVALKRLELAVLTEQNAGEIALKTLESKWASWIKLPKLIILLPVLTLFGVAYVCSMFTKKEMPKRFWDLLA